MITNKPFLIGVILSPILLAVIWGVMNCKSSSSVQSTPKEPVATFAFIPGTEKKPLSSKTFEKLNLSDGTTSTVSFKDFSGKPIIVHYWATWCGSCVEEFPALAKFAQQHKNEIHFVIVANEKNEDVLAYCRKNGVQNIDVYVDSRGTIAASQGVKSLPTTVFASADAIEAGRVVGPIDWDGPSGAVIHSYLTKG